jgi:hypothetical protein
VKQRYRVGEALESVLQADQGRSSRATAQHDEMLIVGGYVELPVGITAHETSR